MAKKARKKETMFDNDVGFVNPSHAKKVLEQATKKFKLQGICSLIAIPSTIAWIITMTGVGQGTALEAVLGITSLIGWLAMIVAVNKDYFKYIAKSVKIAWYLIPVFPMDLALCIFGGAMFFAVSIYVPMIPCLMSLHQTSIIKKAAETYIAACECDDRYVEDGDVLNEAAAF